MKVSFLPRKFIVNRLQARNKHLTKDLITINKDIPQTDEIFLSENVDKLAKIARRNGCHLSFVKNDGFYNNSTKMNIGLPKMEVVMHDQDTPVIFSWYETEASSTLPENLSREKKPFELIKQDIKTLLKLVAENKVEAAKNKSIGLNL